MTELEVDPICTGFFGQQGSLDKPIPDSGDLVCGEEFRSLPRISRWIEGNPPGKGSRMPAGMGELEKKKSIRSFLFESLYQTLVSIEVLPVDDESIRPGYRFFHYRQGLYDHYPPVPFG
jgi:hypothetical protein